MAAAPGDEKTVMDGKIAQILLDAVPEEIAERCEKLPPDECRRGIQDDEFAGRNSCCADDDGADRPQSDQEAKRKDEAGGIAFQKRVARARAGLSIRRRTTLQRPA
jgi:hypothetical protein